MRISDWSSDVCSSDLEAESSNRTTRAGWPGEEPRVGHLRAAGIATSRQCSITQALLDVVLTHQPTEHTSFGHFSTHAKTLTVGTDEALRVLLRGSLLGGSLLGRGLFCGCFLGSGLLCRSL